MDMNGIRRLSKRMTNFLDSKWGGRIMLLLAIVIFLSLTLTRLTASSIWFDESFSAYIIRFDWSDLIHYTAIDVHPPLYYLLLKAWSLLFGANVAALRGLSVALGVVVILLVYLLVKKLFKQRTAVVATILLAISPMFVRYGIEMRMYMLVCVIALLATLVFCKIITATKSLKLRWYVLYGVLLSVGMWTHYMVITVWLAHWVARAVYLHSSGYSGIGLLKKFFNKGWIVAHAVAIALYIPWIPVALKQMSGLKYGFWIPPVTINTPAEYVSDFLLYREASSTTEWWAVLAVITLALILVGAMRARRALIRQDKKMSKMYEAIGILAVAPVLLLMILSLYPLHSMFVERYLMPAVVVSVIVIASAIVWWKGARWLRLSLIVTICLCSVLGIVNVYQLGNYNPNEQSEIKITMTSQLVDKVKHDSVQAPIVDSGTYSYYEAAANEDESHPVYFDWNNVKNDYTGSLQMMRDNKFGRGITDINAFAQQYGQIWYIGHNTNDQIDPPDSAEGWRAIKTIGVPDPLTGKEYYKATLYAVDK